MEISGEAEKYPKWLGLGLPAVWNGRSTHYWPFLSGWFLEIVVQERTTEAHLSVMMSEEEMGRG